MAHRRIRLIGQVIVEDEPPAPPPSPTPENDKKRRYRRRLNRIANSIASPEEAKEEPVELSEEQGTFTPVSVLMIETENIKSDKIVMTNELKVC